MSGFPDHSLSATPQRDDDALPVDRPLTVPLLIRGSFDNALFVFLCISCIILLGLGAIIWIREGNREGATVACSLGGVLAVLATLIGLWLLKRRQWLEVTLTGFVLSRREERRVYSDDQVVGIAQELEFASNGIVKRRLILEIGSEERERIECRYSVPPGKVDPLASFLDRIVRDLARRTIADLEQGGRLRGRGWVFDRHGLHHGRSVYPVESISWCGFFDGRLCLWRGDEERPFLRLSLLSPNASTLGEILWQFIRQRPGHDRPLPGHPLGRVLLERRSLALPGGLATLFVSLPAAGWLWTLAMPQAGPALVACLCIAAVGVLLCWYGRTGRLRFHEHGVALSGWGGACSLLYPEIAEVVWKDGQILTLHSARRPTISFRFIFRQFDAEMASMRDHLCRFLAQRWAAQVPHGPVSWTPRLRFLPSGLEYQPATLLGPGEPVCAPYELTHYRLEYNQFLLFVNDQGQPVCKERVDLTNFFVGLAVLDWIYQGIQQPALPVLDYHPAQRPNLPASHGALDHHVRPAEYRSPGVTVPRPDVE
jgi:hypothetical protein